MIISARMQASIAMTDNESADCQGLFDKDEYTHIPYLHGEWRIISISRSFSGDKVRPWIVDLDLWAKSLER